MTNGSSTPYVVWGKKEDEINITDMSEIQIEEVGNFISDNKDMLGYPKDYTISVKNIRIQTGSKMIVVLLNDIITMPGLPKVPRAVEE